ncbi:hypothetical protein DM01DRAFT_1337807 [Hesseltinella vesiculosa]|uniref:Uncharacterized protein n=1 Tax=Hesseltinella vesiculosa TaxID=101127 RepID=A0A1X2GBP9_9FUNG|nr:hypothetical protein DM01DRAFT_1337807 [Hesseltinella vesiculosa]
MSTTKIPGTSAGDAPTASSHDADVPPPSYAESTNPNEPRVYHTFPAHRTIIITAEGAAVDEERMALITDAIQYDRHFPLAALFFLFGWFCPPLWFFGACCCVGNLNVYEAWWGRMNFIMSISFLMTSLIYSMLVLLTGNWTIV